jgi:hypothetical protein
MNGKKAFARVKEKKVTHVLIFYSFYSAEIQSNSIWLRCRDTKAAIIQSKSFHVISNHKSSFNILSFHSNENIRNFRFFATNDYQLKTLIFWVC